MKYNNTGFNATWASSISEDAFVAHEKHGDLSEKQLREAWQLMNPGKAKAAAPAKPVANGNDKGKDKPGKGVQQQGSGNKIIEGD